MVLGRFLLVVKSGFFLLQMAGISQDDGTQIDRRRRGIDWPVETFFDQPGNPAAMVEMRVRQDYSVDVARRNGSIFPVARSPFLLALKKAAIYEYLYAWLMGRIIACVDEVFRSGNGSGSAKKLKVGHSVLLAAVCVKRTISQESAGERNRNGLAVGT